jgi:hypothetical protein
MSSASQIIRFSERRDLFEKGLTDVYKDTVKIEPQTYKLWLRTEKSKDFYKTDMAVSGLGVMPERTIGSDFQKDRIYYGPNKTYTMKVYGMGLVIQWEVLRWDLYSVFGEISKQLAKSAVTRYDLVAYGLLNNAFVSTNSAYTDQYGEALCANTKARFDGGTWSNRPSSAMGLSMLALNTAMTGLRKTVNHRGIFAQFTPRTVMTSVENEWLLNTLLKSETNPDNANQQFNNARAQNLKGMTSPYITTSSNWWVFCDKSDYKILMGLGDEPDLRSDTEPGSRNMIYTSYCSFRLEVREGMGIYGDAGV